MLVDSVDRLSSINFITINTIEGLDNYSSVIDDFVNFPDVFSSVYHQSSYLKGLFVNTPDLISWEVCIAQAEEKVIAIIPSYIQRKKLPVKFSVYRLLSFNLKVLHLVGSQLAFVNYLSEESIGHIVKYHLSVMQSHFDLAFIESLEIDGYLFRSLNKIDKYTLNSASINPNIIHSIEFPDSWEQYLGAMTKKRRYNLKRNLKVLEKSFSDNIFLKKYEDVDDVRVFINLIDAIYSKTWQSKTLGIKIRSGSVHQLLDEVLASSGCFLSYILYVDNKAVAFIRGYLHKGLYYFEEIGFDMGWSKYSVGNILNMLMLEDLMSRENKVSNLDFGFGDNIYKQVLGNKKTLAVNAFLSMRGSKPYFVVLLIRSFNKIYDVTKGCIENFGLTEKIRKLIKKR